MSLKCHSITPSCPGMTPEMATGRATAPVAHGGAGGQGEQLSALKRGKQSASQSDRKHTSRGEGGGVVRRQAAGDAGII